MRADPFPRLLADVPDPALREKLMLFGWMVGDWAIESTWLRDDGSTVRGRGEIHARWVLAGTAVQDVWWGEVEEPGGPRVAFGTTLRVYDRATDSWRVVWVAPQEGSSRTLVARREGDEIVLSGSTDDGRPERWVFSELRGDSFRWRAEESDDGGASWRLTQDVRARRAA